jgi:hypothetical protein
MFRLASFTVADEFSNYLRFLIVAFDERAAEEFEMDATAIALEDLANTTHWLYFDPKLKNPQL